MYPEKQKCKDELAKQRGMSSMNVRHKRASITLVECAENILDINPTEFSSHPQNYRTEQATT